MVRKEIETKTNKSMIFTGAYFKYKIGLKQLAGWQKIYDKHIGESRQQKLSNVTIPASVRDRIKIIESTYEATGEDWQSDYTELLSSVEAVLLEGGLKEEATQDAE